MLSSASNTRVSFLKILLCVSNLLHTQPITYFGGISIAMEKPRPNGAEAKSSWSTKAFMAFDAAGALPIWAATPFIRHWHLRWHSTDDEVRSDMPGDDIVKMAQFNATRSVTVGVPPERVWPWIAQLGYKRGGFYTYDMLDNASQTSANSVIDEYQRIGVGDLIPMYHELHGLAIAYKVAAFELFKWMVWVHRPNEGEEPDSTWSWRLTPLPGGGTRLVTRMKQDYRWETPGLALFNLIMMEFADFAMERRMLKGIKIRAESLNSS